MAYGDAKAGPAKKSDPLGEAKESAATELADILGVADDKVEAFKTALLDYVKSCVQKELAEENDEGE